MHIFVDSSWQMTTSSSMCVYVCLSVGNATDSRIQSSPIAAIFILCHLRDVHIIFFSFFPCTEHRYIRIRWCTGTIRFVFIFSVCIHLQRDLLPESFFPFFFFFLFFAAIVNFLSIVFFILLCVYVDNDVLNQCFM